MGTSYYSKRGGTRGSVLKSSYGYLSRWMSWSGTPSTPPGSPSKCSPLEGSLTGMPVSPQPPRLARGRSRISSKASNASVVAEKRPYPLVSKLPVPPLGHTLTWYLTHLKPLLSEDEMKETENLVQQFGKPGGVGEGIQEELIKRHDVMDNWAYSWWMEDMYMSSPLALPVNSNPGMVFPKQEFTSNKDMLRFAARIIGGSFETKEKIDLNEVDVDRCSARERHQPLCMEQYARVFTTNRRPAIPRDKQISSANSPKDNQHIVVFYKNHIFRMDIVYNGVLMEHVQIVRKLEEICSLVDAYEDVDPPPIGIMTADNRRTWAQNRQILIGEPVNKKTIGIIETSVLVLCIDSILPEKFNLTTRTSHRASLKKRISNLSIGQNQETSGRDEVNAGHQMIHGGGIKHNSSNRWFDKTVQFVVTRDGWCGLCYEHSPAEGIVVIQLVEQILQNVKEDSNAEEQEKSCVTEGSSIFPSPLRLEWNVTPVIFRRIQEAAENVDRLVNDLDFRILRYLTLGRDYIKKGKCSPDAFIQLALQLAYFRSHGKLTSTYESASLRRFRCGRVDCIRANTPQVLSWCEAVVINAPMKDRMSKFESAMGVQTEIMVNNILGRGIDIHLLGLREMAREMCIEVPELFTHKSYIESNHFRLSTSQVPTISDSWMGYGPVCPDGYSAAYNPHPDCIVFCLSAFKSCEETSTLEFGRNLERALDDMKIILDARSQG